MVFILRWSLGSNERIDVSCDITKISNNENQFYYFTGFTENDNCRDASNVVINGAKAGPCVRVTTIVGVMTIVSSS